MKIIYFYKMKWFRFLVDNIKDIKLIVECLRKNGLIKDLIWFVFENFKDLIKSNDVNKLYDWIKY